MLHKKSATLKKDETLICEKVVFNTGGGYDSKTGVFTVPVSGLYCFMASAIEGTSDEDVTCWVYMELDNQLIANLVASGRGGSTLYSCACLGRRESVSGIKKT